MNYSADTLTACFTSPFSNSIITADLIGVWLSPIENVPVTPLKSFVSAIAFVTAAESVDPAFSIACNNKLVAS